MNVCGYCEYLKLDIFDDGLKLYCTKLNKEVHYAGKTCKYYKYDKK